MKAQASETLPTEDGRWAYEVKWDGMRIVAEVDTDDVRLWSGNGADATARFPELSGLATGLVGARSAVLDGEVVAFDPATGRPDFGRLQPRMQAGSSAAVARASSAQAVQFLLFDVLAVDGTWLLDRPFRERRRLLEQVIEPGPSWRVSPSQEGDGQLLLDAVRAQSLEGVVAKRLDSRYEPGKRTRSWLKVKVRRRQEMVVGGWVPGEGNRTGRIGALLVGYHDAPGDGPLTFAGRVGTGFTDAELRRLALLLDDRTTEECPFDPPPPRAESLRGPRWVRPELVAELEYGEWTSDGRLRHPSYLGLRDDKPARDVTREA
jgi:bifunctional non-homologous end joining protein LigD